MSSTAETQKQTLDKFLDAWTSWSAEGQLALFTDNYTQRTLPLSLGIPSRTKQEASHALPKLSQVVQNAHLEVHHVVHDAEKSKAAVFAVASGDTPFGDFNNEYACFIDFDVTGEKIERLDEFMDSAFLMRFYPSFKKYLAEHSG